MRTWAIPGLLLLVPCLALAQQKIFLRLNQPGREFNEVSSSRQFIVGSTCPGCTLKLNNRNIRVYSSGGFAIQLDLVLGNNSFLLAAGSPSGKGLIKNLYYHYRVPVPPQPVSTFSIASIQTFPEGNLQLEAGDQIRIRIKALPGCKATWIDHDPLAELPADETGGMPGIYQGTYRVQNQDPLLHGNLPLTLIAAGGRTLSTETPYQFSTMPRQPVVGQTIGPLPYLDYGLGGDRLGGAKMGYLDTLVRLHITGKFNDEYRVSLAPGLEAYIPEDAVTLLPEGTFIPRSLTSSWKVWGDSSFDYLSIGLDQRLPYLSEQLTDPTRIVLEIEGATSNTNWISQYLDTREIKSVSYEEASRGRVRVIIGLNHAQDWGYRVYYVGNDLTIRIKHQPENLSLNHLTIAVDAGHGGSNLGALGPTGVREKTLTLKIAERLRRDLEQAGAHVIMTRNRDIFVSMEDRTLMLRKEDPDLMVSIHLNASADPIHVSGTSTYYRYPGFRPLSLDIYKRMVALGLNGYGNVGGFNFALNGPTDFPNALVETVFLSNPADEDRVLKSAFRQRIARAILAGIQDFLAGCARNP